MDQNGVKTRLLYRGILFFVLFLMFACKKDENSGSGSKDILQLVQTKVGTTYLSLVNENADLPVDKNIVVEFNNSLDTSTVKKSVLLLDNSNSSVVSVYAYLDNFKSVALNPVSDLENFKSYTLKVGSDLKGAKGETFPGVEYHFTTINGTMKLDSITINGLHYSVSNRMQNIDRKNINLKFYFSDSLDASNYQQFFAISNSASVGYAISSDSKTITLSNTENWKGFTKYTFTISPDLKSKKGFIFGGFSGSFYTNLDSTLKFPLLSDDDLLNLVQEQTFKYFYDFAHPACGLARERNTSGDVVTIGGSGFGVMALIVGMNRGFITRNEGVTRLDKILSFLETCDRYHGAWPHWLNGTTGKTVPFSPNDDGGDLVETSFMVEGLLTMRQYLNSTDGTEKPLIDRINALCDSVQYDWFTRGENVLYWHWSPNNGWAVNLKIEGYNETLITYILAASSAKHTISPDVYKLGYAKNGGIKNGKSFYGYILPLGQDYGGPLFFTHYSFLGLDPRNLNDEFANYWEQNVNQSLINWSYCKADPKNYVGYSSDCWGLTASDNPWGYSAHSPTNDLGVITPTAAVSSLPYTPEQSMNAIKQFYYLQGDKLWGDYGFYDAFDATEGWYANSYLAIDEGPIICMIENYRTGLLWNLFMSNPEVKAGLDKLGFTY